jgi:predicted metal-dependent peptidase
MTNPSGTLANLPPEQRLSAARMKAYGYMPYFTMGIQSLIPHPAPGMGTLGVTQGNHLLVDYEALGAWTAAEAGGVVLHEWMHRFSKHAERFLKLVANGIAEPGDADTWNEACDAEINCSLIEANIPLPGDPVTPASLNMPPHRLAEEYFFELKKRRPPGGGGGGNKPPEGSGVAGPHSQSPHEPSPSEDPGRSVAEQDVQNRHAAEAIHSASKSRGSVPQNLLRQAGAMLAPPKINWTDKLSVTARNIVNIIAGEEDYAFDVRSRMQDGLSILLGEEDTPYLPGTQAHTVELWFAVDTSGSVSEAALKRTVSEASAVLAHMGGAKITFVSIDAKIHELKPVSSVDEIWANMRGGGGTDFRPLFEAARKHKPKPDVIVFSTDGYGPAPAVEPEGIKTIWLVIDGETPASWGEAIHISTSEDFDEDHLDFGKPKR